MFMAQQSLTTAFTHLVKPVWATFVAAASLGANGLVAIDVIKGWAAAITIIVGAPTAIFISVYWGIKMVRAIRHPERKD